MKEKAESLGIKVDGRWSEARLKEEIERAENAVIEGADAPENYDLPEETPKEPEETEDIDAMNDLANRIWSGQSPDLPEHERMFRVKKGCEAQGYTRLDEIVIDE